MNDPLESTLHILILSQVGMKDTSLVTALRLVLLEALEAQEVAGVVVAHIPTAAAVVAAAADRLENATAAEGRVT